MDLWPAYLDALRRPFRKLCRLRFLQPDGTAAFVLDNNPANPLSPAFVAEGTITYNWQNGRRTSASVTLSNPDGRFDFSFSGLWFGQEIALDEGLVLPGGAEFYLPQGVFLIESSSNSDGPGGRTAQLALVDKVAALDGTLGGTLEETHQVQLGANIFSAIAELLAEDRGNGLPLDRVKPIFTDFYNERYEDLPDGSSVSMALSPYTLTVDSDSGTVWDAVSGLADMVNAWIGYDETGALRFDPSQNDVLDAQKPVLWDFSTDEPTLLSITENPKPKEVYNDFIVFGEMMGNGHQTVGRAQILDPRSPCSVQTIGRKTKRVPRPGFGTDQQCRDYAEQMVMRTGVLQSSVSISCSQLFHIRGNGLVTVRRTDRPGAPVERHLVQGFSRPLAGSGAMTITAVSASDFPVATVT